MKALVDIVPLSVIQTLLTALTTLLAVYLGGRISMRSYKLEQINTLRIAALEKRLEIHQNAYTLWTEICNLLDEPDKLKPLILNAHQWWVNNCLYLSEPLRSAFKSALYDVEHYIGNIGRIGCDGKVVESRPSNRIRNLFFHIEDGVGLPPIGLTDEEWMNMSKIRNK